MTIILSRITIKGITSEKKTRNPIARDLFSSKYKKRIVKSKKGKGSFKRKKKISLI
jgi:alternative ribosome-rescue factor